MSEEDSKFSNRMSAKAFGEVAIDTPEATRWRDWRKEREEGLSEEHGWLSLVSFTWIDERETTLEKFPGTWWVDGDSLNVRCDSGVTTTAGEPVVGDRSWSLEENQSVMELVSGSVLAEVAKRGGRYAVRLRDSKSPTVTEFNGVPVFGYDESFVYRGQVRRVDSYDVDRDTYRDDVPAHTQIVAELELNNPMVGQGETADTVTLRLEGSVNGTLVLNFHDETNGSETADWRFVTFDSPFIEAYGKTEGDVAETVVDFNYALNFPSAFTDYGTCPKPVPGNVIPWAIQAGEKNPR